MKTSEQIDLEKLLAAESAARIPEIRDGAKVGLGSGSTSNHFIRALGKRVRAEGLKLLAVATSKASEELAAKEGIAVSQPTRGLKLDVTVDGADEIGPGLALIKGGGGALFREKLVAEASVKMVVIADSTKYLPKLGKFHLPVEVVPFAVPWVMDRLADLGCPPTLRMKAGAVYVTDQGNHILDCACVVIEDPAGLAAKIDHITGVVEHGLFIGIAKTALVADGETVRTYTS